MWQSIQHFIDIHYGMNCFATLVTTTDKKIPAISAGILLITDSVATMPGQTRLLVSATDVRYSR